MNRLSISLRWAFAVAWIASAAWLTGCVHEVLGWRGPGDLFLAWSVPALPVFVATADWWGRGRGRTSQLWLAELVVVWAGALWWLAAEPRVPRSPGQFVTATGAVLTVSFTVLVVQAAMLLRRPQPPRATPRVERRNAVATPVGAR